jgi:hypothetical protein
MLPTHRDTPVNTGRPDGDGWPKLQALHYRWLIGRSVRAEVGAEMPVAAAEAAAPGEYQGGPQQPQGPRSGGYGQNHYGRHR